MDAANNRIPYNRINLLPTESASNNPILLKSFANQVKEESNTSCPEQNAFLGNSYSSSIYY